MKLKEAISQVIIPEQYSVHLCIYQNALGDQRARVEFKRGDILDKSLARELILDHLPEADYDWKVRNNTLYAVILNCDHQYRITTRITRV